MKKIVKFKKYSGIAAFFVLLMCLSSCAPTIEYEVAKEMYNEIEQNYNNKENEIIADKYSYESFDSTVYNLNGTKQYYETTMRISVDLDLAHARIFIKKVVNIPSNKDKRISIYEKYVSKNNDNYRFGERIYENNQLISEEEYINGSWIDKNETISYINSYARSSLYNTLSTSNNIFFNYENGTPFKDTYFISNDETSLLVGATILSEEKGLDVTSKHAIEFKNNKLTNYKYKSDKVNKTNSMKVDFNFSFEYDNPYCDTRTFQDIENYLK